MAAPRYYAASQSQKTSTGTSDVQTFAVPSLGTDGARHVLITVETTDARMTFDGSTPSSSNGHILPKSALPLYLPIAGSIKFVSTASANCVVNVTWMTD